MHTWCFVVGVCALVAMANGCGYRARCQTDGDCRAHYYCHPEHKVCFGLPTSAPVLAETLPPSPANNASPELLGTAEPGVDVLLYTDVQCEGPLLGATTASAEGTFRVRLAVPENRSTTVYAVAERKGTSRSSCSGGLTYVEDSEPPTLVSVMPAGGTTEAELVGPINVTFSEELRPSTVNASTIQLRLDGGSVRGTVMASERTAVFTPTSPLGMRVTYEVQATAGVTDRAGNPLSEESRTFTTRDGRWGPTVRLDSPDGGTVLSAELAMDSQGRVTAVWGHTDGGRNSIWVNRFTPDAGWAPAEFIESELDSSDPKVAVDDTGGASIAWRRASRVWTSQFDTALQHWSVPEAVDQDGGLLKGGFDIGSDPTGYMVITWAQNSDGGATLWARRALGAAQPVTTIAAGMMIRNPRLAMSADRNALVVWEQWDGTKSSVWGSGFQQGGPWRPAQRISDGVGDAKTPVVAMARSGSGAGMVVWVQSDNAYSNTWSKRYAPIVGWETPQLVDANELGDAYEPQIAVDTRGNSIAVWLRADGTRLSIWSNGYDMNNWLSAQLITSSIPGDSWFPHIAMDNSGNAIAAWPQRMLGNCEIRVARHLERSGWQPSFLISEIGNEPCNIRIAINDFGTAATVWTQRIGDHHSIYTREYR